ncbi:MAG: hypothetical protein EBR23_12400, partial [Planctomycetia bacterium]|nr:hypothetical protein [Planctomycetia bacterium]
GEVAQDRDVRVRLHRVAQLRVQPGQAALLRTVSFRNSGLAPANVSARALLYPNLMLFDEYFVDRQHPELTATGFCTLRLRSPEATGAGDRHLQFDLGPIAPGGSRACTLILSLGESAAPLDATTAGQWQAAAANYWGRVARVDPGEPALAHLFQVSVAGLRAAVAASGKMDGAIWQYNLEWVRDQSMVAAAAAMAGLTDPAAGDPAPRLLERILERSIDAHGGTVDSSRLRPAELAELDQNGELLHALWIHWVWTGDAGLIRKNLPKLVRIAEYLQRPEFVDPDSGLLHNSREYWERDPHFGVRDGFENSYQLWTIVGFNALADMLEEVGGDAPAARRWREAAGKLQTAFLSHPRHALIERGTLVKRRLPDGAVQRRLEPPNRAGLPPGMPLSTERENFCDPDTASVLPIIHGVVDPQGPVARATLDAMEALWNQRWSGGGYGRYDVTSESDSPGPWPFPSLFVARANLVAGNHDRVWRTLRWLAEVPGG